MSQAFTKSGSERASCLRLPILTLLALGTLLAQPSSINAQGQDFAPIPLVQPQDGSVTAIENFLSNKNGWWSSFRVAFGSDFYYPDSWIDGPTRFPFRLRVKTGFFGREIVVPGYERSLLAAHPADSARGLSGFPCNDTYYAMGNLVIQEQDDGVGPRPLIVLSRLDGIIRSLFFDTVGTFYYDILATTTNGSVYRIDRLGKAVKLATLDEDIKATDIAPLDSSYGPFAGQLIVVTRPLGHVRAISNTGIVTQFETNRDFSGAEALYILPKSDPAGAVSCLLHWPLRPAHAYTEQRLNVDAFALVFVRNRGRRQLLTLQINGSSLEVTTLFDLSKIDEVTFLRPARLRPGGSCPVAPTP